MKAVRILFVTGIFPPDHGGPASYVPSVAKALAPRHTVLGVVTLSDRLDHDDSRFPFPVIRIRRGENRLLRWMRTVSTVRRLARGADLVYLNGLVLEGVVACKLLSRRRVAVKVVGDLIWERARNAGATRRTLDEFQQGRSGWRWELLRRLQGWYTGRADRVITPSRYLARIVEGWGVSPGRISVVYNSTPAADQPLPDAGRQAVDCVTVARLVPWKGLSALVSVACRNGWTLDVVGDGPLLPELRAQVAREGGEQLVRFLGHQAHDAVAERIRGARVFVLNSSYEGLPHVVLEAQAAAVPVVATAVGGTPETITHGVTGFLVPPGDDDALAGSIRRLLDDPEARERVGRAGRDSVRARFSFRRMVDETEQALVGASRPAAAAAGPRAAVPGREVAGQAAGRE